MLFGLDLLLIWLSFLLFRPDELDGADRFEVVAAGQVAIDRDVTADDDAGNEEGSMTNAP